MKKEEKKEYGNPKSLNNVSKQGGRIRVQFDIDYKGSKGQVVSSDSDTMPDMTLTVRQLLENHTRGKDSNVFVRQPLYFETQIPTLTDITDVDKFKKSLEERLKQVNDFLKNEKEKQKESKDQEVKVSNDDNSKEIKPVIPFPEEE